MFHSFLFSRGVLGCVYAILTYKTGTGSRKSSLLFVIDGWLLFIGGSTCQSERLACVELSLKTKPARPLFRAQIQAWFLKWYFQLNNFIINCPLVKQAFFCFKQISSYNSVTRIPNRHNAMQEQDCKSIFHRIPCLEESFTMPSDDKLTGVYQSACQPVNGYCLLLISRAYTTRHLNAITE